MIFCQTSNHWFSDKVATQLANGKLPYDVKIYANLQGIKPIHANCITATSSWVERNYNSWL